MSLMMCFPNGDKRSVEISSAMRVINRNTAMKELVVTYIEGSEKHYTPLVNVLGKWYKNLNWVDYGDYAFEAVEYDYLKDLPKTIEVFDHKKEFSNEDVDNYCNGIRNKICNILGRNNPEYLDNKHVNDLITELFDRSKECVLELLRSDDTATCGLAYWITEEVLFRISNSLSSLDELISELNLCCRKYSNIKLETVKDRYGKIAKITAVINRFGKSSLNFVVFALAEVDIMAMDDSQFDEYVLELKDSLKELKGKMLDMQVLNKFVGVMKSAIKYKKNVLEKQVQNTESKEKNDIFVVVDPMGLDDDVRMLFYTCVENTVEFTMTYMPITVSDQVISDVREYLKVFGRMGNLKPLAIKDNFGSEVVYNFGFCDNRGKFNYLINSHSNMDLLEIDVTKKNIDKLTISEIFNKGMNGAYTLRIPSKSRVYYGLEN